MSWLADFAPDLIGFLLLSIFLAVAAWWRFNHDDEIVVHGYRAGLWMLGAVTVSVILQSSGVV